MKETKILNGWRSKMKETKILNGWCSKMNPGRDHERCPGKSIPIHDETEILVCSCPCHPWNAPQRENPPKS